MWVIRTEIGNFAGNARPGEGPLVRSLGSLSEAQALVNYPLQAFARLPEGYALREVRLALMAGSTWAFQF
jgi:hypothetical protein